MEAVGARRGAARQDSNLRARIVLRPRDLDREIAIGLLLAIGLRGLTAGSPRYRADVLELERLGDGGGFRVSVEITLADGTRLQLPLEAEHKRPRNGATVTLWRGDACLAPGDDPRTAEEAILEHPLETYETYGWPACLIGLGVLGLAIPFIPE